MGLNVGGNLITQGIVLGSAVLTINTGVTMTMLSTGGVVRPNQIQFQAKGNPSGAVTFADGVWTKMPFPNAVTNVNSCYSAANARFTAPVGGRYFFQASSYLLKNGANNAYYWHPIFAVNGSLSGRVVNTAYPNYRLRGYGVPGASYLDSHITQLYELVAGDYVEHHVYCTGAGQSVYTPEYMRFTGFLLG
jgi:hypothetical protein